MITHNTNLIFEKLNEFIKKYYQNQLIKGSIYTVSILIIFFLLFSIIEHFWLFGVDGRTFLFWTYILLNLFVICSLIIPPTLHLFKIGNTLKHKEAAKIIGKHFSEIDDKLLNVLELSEISDSDNELITASINQKIKKISPISLKKAVDFSVNKKHLKWALTPICVVIIFIISGKDYILTESSARIIKHNTFFEPKSPFNYKILNSSLSCKQFDNFLLKIIVDGNEIPSEIFIKQGKNKFKMNTLNNNRFDYEFLRVHNDISFQFYSGGYLSKVYTIKSLPQPKVVSLRIKITPPKYTGKKMENIENNGDLIVSEGSLVKWNIKLKNSTKCYFIVDEKIIKKTDNNQINTKLRVLGDHKYSIVSLNNTLNDTLSYNIKAIKDEFPKIILTQTYDTINTNYLFRGYLEDDYLIEKLDFHYSYNINDSIIKHKENINIQKLSSENFFYTFNFEDLNVGAGKEISYHFKVWDNDAVNGSKFTKSKSFTYKVTSMNRLIEQKDTKNEETKRGINKSIELAEELQKEIKKLKKKILESKKIGWEEREKANNILKKQKLLEKQIIKTQKNNSENLRNQKKLKSSSLEKQKLLEALMKKVVNEEMKKLLQEIEQLMDKANKEKLKDLLEKLEKENINVEKELNRELELFKQLDFEQKTEEILEKIAKTKMKQIKLKNEIGKKGNKTDDLLKKQIDINLMMDTLTKEIEILRKKNTDLDNKNKIPETKNLEEDIKQKIKESIGAIKKNLKNKSKKAQQDAIENLDKLEEKLQSMRQSYNEEKPIEDMEALRKILDNLITLSFDQEHLMIESGKTNKKSSEFIKIVQKQNALSDNSKIIEDSLYALSKRVVQIQAKVNQEITSIKSNMQKATTQLEKRNINNATKRQQFVMTSTNNLALLLSEILEQMQKQLDTPPSDCNKPRNCNKPNSNSKKPSISELKKAQKKLSKKIKKGSQEKNKKGNKIGEKQSKEMMNLTITQAKIRKQLMQLRDEIGKNGEKGNIDKIIKEMEETERDIINNQITQETINRQENILSRLLEAENSKKERDKDDERKAVEWRLEQNKNIQEFLNFEKNNKSQQEMLKTTPLQLAPYYKKKVTLYFNKIIND